MHSYLDIIIIIFFSFFILSIGLLFSRTGINIKSFFAGGEAVPWLISGLSLFMSFFSAGTFVAWGSVAYEFGWVSVTIQWTMALGALVAAYLIAPKWKQTGNLTAAEYIKERLGGRVQKLYIYIFMTVSLFIKGAVLYPVAKLVSTSLGLPLAETTIVLGMMMIAYTAAGGLWAVMVTDILQFVVLTSAVLIILPLAFDKIGGISAFMQNAPDGFFDWTGGQYTGWFIFAFTVYHIFYIGGNWTFVQRYTSVESPKAAGKVAYIFAALYFVSPVIWMLPPMIYKLIDPSLQGLDTENAYLKVCQLVLPPGLMGLMLTGMYFSTSATANTTLNVVSAVFTNDIYKSRINPSASDKKLMKVARISSWFLGLLMIIIALVVPYIGGMVEVVLTVAAITAGPLLAPPIWALFSKRLTGKSTIYITAATLLLNLFLKLILPAINGLTLSRATEMLVGVCVPFILLAIDEYIKMKRGKLAEEFVQYKEYKLKRTEQLKMERANVSELIAIKKQNRFGLKIISFSLLLTAVILFGLSVLSGSGRMATAIVGAVILLSSAIPFIASKRVNREIVSMHMNDG